MEFYEGLPVVSEVSKNQTRSAVVATKPPAKKKEKPVTCPFKNYTTYLIFNFSIMNISFSALLFYSFINKHLTSYFSDR